MISEHELNEFDIKITDSLERELYNMILRQNNLLALKDIAIESLSNRLHNSHEALDQKREKIEKLEKLMKTLYDGARVTGRHKKNQLINILRWIRGKINIIKKED